MTVELHVELQSVAPPGFDGVELHEANGYLIEQFLRDGVNDRTGEYGGTVENHCRFLLDTVRAPLRAIGSDRGGVRISPFTDILEVTNSNSGDLAVHIAKALNHHKVLYLHVIERRLEPYGEAPTEDVMLLIRKAFNGPFIAGGGFTRATRNDAIASGRADPIV